MGVVDDYNKAYEFGAATWKVRVDSQKKKQKEIEDKAKAEARKKRLAEGGFWVSLEEYTKMAAELFAAHPWFSFPGMLLLFFLIFKFCRSRDRDDTPPPRRPAKPASKKATTEKDSDSILRKRAGKGAATEEAEETSKTK